MFFSSINGHCQQQSLPTKREENVVSECPLTFTESEILRAFRERHGFSLMNFKRSWIETTLISITSPESLLSVPGVTHVCTARAQYSFLANRTQLVWIIEGTCLPFLGSRWRQQLENSYRAKLISQLRSVNENCFSSMSVFLCSLIKNIGSKTLWQRFEIVEYWRRYHGLKPPEIIFRLNWETLEALRGKITFGDYNLHDALSNFHIMF